MQKRVVDIKADSIQIDEIWTTVRVRLKNKIDPEIDKSEDGDFYTFLAMENKSKLLFPPTVGKRTELTTELFAESLAKCVEGRTQITTDGYRPYRTKIKKAFGDRIDFAQYYKELNLVKGKVEQKTIGSDGKIRTEYKLKKKEKSVISVRAGNPDKSKIGTSHIERCNATLRLMNKRFNRETLAFSKRLEYLHYSVMLFAGYYNFVKHHSALGKKITPAVAQGIAERCWDVPGLIAWS